MRKRKTRLYEDFKDDEITREEYETFKKNYDSQISEIKITLINLQNEIDKLSEEKSRECTEPSRALIVKFIDKIIVYEGGKIEIIPRYKNDLSPYYHIPTPVSEHNK